MVTKATSDNQTTTAATVKPAKVNSIIEETKALGKAITSGLSTYQSNGVRMHVLFVSAVYHAAVHGNASHLQRLYDGLRTNDQVSVKQALRRIAAIVGLNGAAPDGLPAENIQVAVAAGGILELKKGSFVILQGHTSDAAKATAKLMVDRFVNPDGKVDRMVFDRNNFAEIRTLGDTDVLSAIIKAASVDNTDKRVHNLTETTRKWLDQIKSAAETRLKTFTLAEG